MAKLKTVFACQECGFQSQKWLGRCPDCNAWNTLVEERSEPTPRNTPWIGENLKDAGFAQPASLASVQSSSEMRFPTGLSEFDRVLGGGVVAGSVVLIGGDPGIGKSTLILQSIHALATGRGRVLYVSGEESPAQIKLRADRLQINSEAIYLLAETALETILQQAQALSPVAIVVDSIQTLYTSQLASAPGSVGQIREVAAQLMCYAKRHNVAIFMIGHVTKEGAIAGPRVLEHIVDTVLYFEGDKSHAYRLLRAVKNRFGAANELGIFEMKGSGLTEVANPSGLFLAERPKDATGSVVMAAYEGSRPLLVELQSLVSPSYLGTARRVALGVDSNRVSLLLAILEKRAGMQIGAYDVYVNVVGGISMDEPAVDLGIVAAVASSFRDRPIAPETVVMGEIGLAGEIRPVQHASQRLREAEKLGFKRCLLPKRNEETLRREETFSIEMIGLSHIHEALAVLF